MTTGPGADGVPVAGRQKTHWPGLVWAVPLAALFFVAYLGIHAWARRGEVITVTFDRAADAKPGETKVLYEGVEYGHLLKIVPNKDGHRLDFLLRVTPEAKPGLNSNARFWLIGASPNLTDLSSLKAVVSGVAIGYAPGKGGTPQTAFDGLEKAPTVLPGTPGTRYLLESHTLGPIREGSGLLFHGQLIGKVTDVRFDGATGFQLEVFVFAPYDALIKPGTRFWKMSPLRLSLSGGGISASLAPASTLLSGGIDIEVPPAVTDVGSAPARSPADAKFILYANRGAARQGLSGPTVRYDFVFTAPAGDLDEEAAVTLLGFQIGEVETTHLAFDARTGKPFTAVTAVIYPQQLDIKAPAGAGGWREATDAKIRQLLEHGFRARLQQTPALVGSESIALVEVKGAPRAELAEDSANPRIPSAPGSSSIEDITAKADEIMAKVNRVPIEQIGENLRQVTDRLNALVSSPKMTESLNHLSATLAEVDQMLSQVQPQLGPLIAKLSDAAGQISAAALAAHQLLGNEDDSASGNLSQTIHQLDEAARSVRTLADFLDRHPEALIRGKRPNPP
jgi:paraquat-inducible protein B